MTRTNPLNVPSSPPRTSAMTMLVDVRKNLDGENEIHWKSKKMNQNCTGATSYQRSKSNKKIIWMKKISPHSFVYSDKLQLWMVTMSLKGDPSF